jgi:hypothetical protein
MPDALPPSALPTAPAPLPAEVAEARRVIERARSELAAFRRDMQVSTSTTNAGLVRVKRDVERQRQRLETPVAPIETPSAPTLVADHVQELRTVEAELQAEIERPTQNRVLTVSQPVARTIASLGAYIGPLGEYMKDGAAVVKDFFLDPFMEPLKRMGSGTRNTVASLLESAGATGIAAFVRGTPRTPEEQRLAADRETLRTGVNTLRARLLVGGLQLQDTGDVSHAEQGPLDSLNAQVSAIQSLLPSASTVTGDRVLAYFMEVRREIARQRLSPPPPAGTTIEPLSSNTPVALAEVLQAVQAVSARTPVLGTAPSVAPSVATLTEESVPTLGSTLTVAPGRRYTHTLVAGTAVTVGTSPAIPIGETAMTIGSVSLRVSSGSLIIERRVVTPPPATPEANFALQLTTTGSAARSVTLQLSPT